MSTAPSASTLDRVFLRSDWTSRSGLFAFGWGLLAAVSLIPLVFCFLFLMEIVETRGVAILSVEQAVEAHKRYGVPDLENLPENGAVRIANSGLLSIVLRGQGSVEGRIAEFAYVQIPSMQRTQSAIVALASILVSSLVVLLLAVERNGAAVDRFTQMIVARVRRMLHRQVLRLGQSDLSGSVFERASLLFGPRTVLLGENLSRYIRLVTAESALVMGLMIAGLLVDWMTFLICLLPLEAGWLIWRYFVRRGQNEQQSSVQEADKDLEIMLDGLRTARLVRGYQMESLEADKFQKLIDDYRLRRSEVAESSRWRLRIGAAIGLTISLIVLVILETKLAQSSSLEFALPKAITLVALVGGISLLIKDLGSVKESLNECRDIAQEVNTFLDLKPQVGQAVGAKFMSPVEKSIYFESVYYTEPESKTPLLQNLDLKIKAGETVAMISLDRKLARSVAWMMPRLIEPQSGRILFDGEDIAWGTLESVRAETLIASAEDPLLNGTVLENLTGGSTEYSLQQATDAAKLAHAHNFISRLPKGYETKLGVYGHPLNEGERYLLSLARAALRNPAVLILEEPIHSLEEDVKNLLDDSYSRLFPNRTVIVLPGRLSSVKKTDRIFFLHGGRVQAVGTHATLVQNEGLYRHWEYSRFNEFRDEHIY